MTVSEISPGGMFFVTILSACIGAAIVGICWAAAKEQVKAALNQANWDAKGELERTQAKMLRKAMRREAARLEASNG